MPKYFKNIKSEAEAKDRYRSLANKHHPDKGGSAEKFQEVKKEYEDILTYFKMSKELAIPQAKPRVKAKPVLKKDYADQLIDQAGSMAQTAVKAGIEGFLNKFFSVK